MTEHGPNGAEARFSTDKAHRYTLRRFLEGGPGTDRTVVWVMLNPSTADAFVLDPTVRRCVKFAARWGFDVCDVVNLYAFRSPKPRDLYKAKAKGVEFGDDRANDEAILDVCGRADLVIAAWGNHGNAIRNGRADRVRVMLERAGVELYHLGLTVEAAPLHPLARGKSRIPDDREPKRWVPWRDCAP